MKLLFFNAQASVVYLCLACLLLSQLCKAQPVDGRGTVILSNSFFEPAVNAYVKSVISFPDMKMWYKDSFFIQELFSIHIEKAYSKPEKRWVELVGYTFIDLPNRAFYHYKTFSDTAKLVAKWTQPDTVMFNDYGGVWNFWSPQKIKPAKPPTVLPDTVRDGILYERLTFRDRPPNGNSQAILYFRCDKKGTPFQHDKVLSKQVGCPLTRYEHVPSKKVPHAMTTEIEFAKSNLSPEELRVFAAWEKNARENPVQK